LDGILPAPMGIPQIEVTLDIDANGILSVTAKDKATGKENKVRIEGGSQLSKEDIERMRQEAEENEENDRMEKERIEKFNAADSLCYQTERQVKESEEFISEQDRDELTKIVSELREALHTNNESEVDVKKSALEQMWSRVSQEIYQKQSDSAQQTPDTDVSDVDYEEVK
jgi:molecular chaperone DnaK